jgi:uncharacterized protein (DUF427 family)
MCPKPISPQPDRESVWDYPRPPRLERSQKQIKIIFNGITLAATNHAYRVLETSHPPVYYLPPEDIQMQYLQPTTLRGSFCEWKGVAGYYTVMVESKKAENAAWFYHDPTPDFAKIKDYVAFYAALMDACYLNEELVQPQPGGFYGGWITSDLIGPFKGESASWGW